MPTHAVSPDGSFGSTVIELTAWIPKDPETKSQLGCPFNAFLVVQIPPPAAAAHKRHWPGLQVGAIASTVVRPPATYAFGT